MTLIWRHCDVIYAMAFNSVNDHYIVEFTSFPMIPNMLYKVASLGHLQQNTISTPILLPFDCLLGASH